MKTNKLSLIIIYSLLVILCGACAMPITTEHKDYRATIQRGDTATLYWEFTNARYVVVDGQDEHYYPSDTCFVAPIETTSYTVTAYRQYEDSVPIRWLVEVIDYDATGIASSPIAGAPIENNGRGDINDVSSFTIIGIAPDVNDDSKYYMRFVANNVNGELVHNLQFNKNNVSINAGIAATLTPTKISEYKVQDNTTYNFCFCIDNSDAAINNTTITNGLAMLSDILPKADNLFVSYFNQNYSGVEKIQRENDATLHIELPEKNGFCAINKSVGQAINYLVNNEEGRNVVVIITSSADNASVLYDERDLIEHAKNNNIPIYVLALGASTPTYNLELLANATGGRLFLLNDDEVGSAVDYLKLIAESQRQFYLAEMFAEIPANEPKLVVEMNINFERNDIITDGIYYPLYSEKIFSEYQVLASFQVRDTILADQYLLQIANLAEVMKANAELVVELIGNAGYDEGNDDQCQKLALRRAQIVRRMLIEDGVHPENIRLSSEGAARPLYQTPHKDWQKNYNNRVEIRWLLPEEYPYEIIAEYSTSEIAAINVVEKWEKKGYKSYYQRIMKNNRPAYRVLIWGYQTEEDADKIARNLTKKEKKLFVVK